MSQPTSIPPGWNVPRPVRLPRPTAAPALFAFGVTLFALGIVTSALLLLVASALVLFALGRWIGEIRREDD